MDETLLVFDVKDSSCCYTGPDGKFKNARTTLSLRKVKTSKSENKRERNYGIDNGPICLAGSLSATHQDSTHFNHSKNVE